MREDVSLPAVKLHHKATAIKLWDTGTGIDIKRPIRSRVFKMEKLLLGKLDVQWYLGTHRLRDSSNLVLSALGREVFQPSALAHPSLHLLEPA